jgi:hypothetical protein
VTFFLIDTLFANFIGGLLPILSSVFCTVLFRPQLHDLLLDDNSVQ